MSRIYCLIAAAIACGLTDPTQADKCEKQRFEGQSGLILSPGFPVSYPPDSNCDYVIKASKDHYIELIFLKFNLQPALDDEVTDYLQIIDGRTSDQAGNVTYRGEMDTPFIFRSRTNRLLLTFVTDDSISNPGFMVQYQSKTTLCEPSVAMIRNGETNCIGTKNRELIRQCKVSCNDNYELHGENVTTCVQGKLDSPPTCRADREKLDICSKDINDPECPFTEEEANEEIAAYIDDLGDLELFGSRDANSKPFCRKEFCQYDRTKDRYKIVCGTYERWYVKTKKLTAPRALFWKEKICKPCQTQCDRGTVGP